MNFNELGKYHKNQVLQSRHPERELIAVNKYLTKKNKGSQKILLDLDSLTPLFSDPVIVEEIREAISNGIEYNFDRKIRESKLSLNISRKEMSRQLFEEKLLPEPIMKKKEEAARNRKEKARKDKRQEDKKKGRERKKQFADEEMYAEIDFNKNSRSQKTIKGEDLVDRAIRSGYYSSRSEYYAAYGIHYEEEKTVGGRNKQNPRRVKEKAKQLAKKAQKLENQETRKAFQASKDAKKKRRQERKAAKVLTESLDEDIFEQKFIRDDHPDLLWCDDYDRPQLYCRHCLNERTRILFGEASHFFRRTENKEETDLDDDYIPIFGTVNYESAPELETFNPDFTQKLSIYFADFRALISNFQVPPSVANLMMGLVPYMYQCYRASSFTDVAVATIVFARSITSNLGSLLAPALSSLHDIFMRTGGFIFSRKAKIVSESFEETWTDFKHTFMQVVSGSVSRTLHKLVVTLVTMQLFSKDLVKKILPMVDLSERPTHLQMVESIFSTVDLVIRVGKEVSKGTPMAEILLCEDPVLMFFNKTRDLMYYDDKLYVGLPQEGMMCRRMYQVKINEFVAVGDSLLDKLLKVDSRRTAVRERRFQLMDIAHRMRNECIGGPRQPPISVVLHGDPGIGKSKLLVLLAHVFTSVKRPGNKFVLEQMFSRVLSSQYWEGYDPHKHPIIHYSEVGNAATEMVKRNGDTILSELNSLIDGLPFAVDMAFGDKGKVYADPEMVLIDTNNARLHADSLMYCPSAMLRRFLYIEPIVLQEFKDEGSTALNIAKSLKVGGNLLDRYKFNVYTYKVKGRKGEQSNVREFDLKGLVAFLREYFADCIEKQDKVNNIDYDFVYNVDVADNVELTRAQEEELGFNIDELDLEDKQDFDSDVEFYAQEPDWGPDDNDANEVKTEAFHDYFEGSEDHWHRIYEQSAKAGDFSRRKAHTKLLRAAAARSIDGDKEDQLVDIYLERTYKRRSALRLWFYRLADLGAFILFTCKFILFLLGAIIVHFGGIQVNWKRSAVKMYQIFKANLRQDTNYVFQRYRAPGSWIRPLMVLIMAATGCYMLFKPKKKNQPNSEATEFHVNSPWNLDLLSKEEAFGCDVGVRRVAAKSKEHAAWNIVRNTKPVVFNGDPKELYAAVVRNCRRVRVLMESHTTSSLTHILGVCKGYALINTHALRGKRSGTIKWSATGNFDDPHQTHVVTFYPYDLRDVGNDVTVIYLRSGFNFRDISKHFHDSPLPTVPLDAVFYGDRIRTTFSDQDLKVEDNHSNVNLVGYITYAHTHGQGMCGMPVIARVGSSACSIVAIHTGGSSIDNTCFGSVLSRQTINEAISALQSIAVDLPVFSQAQNLVGLELPISKSSFTWEHFPFLEYYGKLPGRVVMPKRSNIVETVFAPDLPSFFKKHFNFERKEEYTKPIFKPGFYDIRGERKYLNPYSYGLNKMNTANVDLKPQVVHKVIKRLTKRIIDGLHEKGISELCPLTVEQAVNGVERNDFISRINASTSGGYGYTGSKDKYIPIVCDLDEKIVREPDEDLKRRMLEIYETYEREEMCGFIFNGQLKDEPRLTSKVEKGATRIFYMSSLDFLIVSRMFLQPFYSLMVEFGDIFYTAVGINMHTEAHHAFTKLLEHSNLLMEGDFGGFDVTMPIGITRATNTIVYNVLSAMGYTKDALRQVQGILSDNAYPLLSINLDILSKPGMQPSGKYATAEDNSLKLLFIFAYVWYDTPELADLDFFEYVKAVLYGDDSLLSVSEKVAVYFNNVTFQKACAEKLNMEFTSSSKSSEVVEFINPKDATFLKRNFVYKEDKNVYEAPLSLDSMYKMLQWLTPSNNVTVNEQLLGITTSALWEFYFHCDGNVHESCVKFELIRADLLEMLTTGLEMTSGTFNDLVPSFYDIHLRIYPEENQFGTDDPTADEKEYSPKSASTESKEDFLVCFAGVSPYKGKPDSPQEFVAFVGDAFLYQWRANFEHNRVNKNTYRDLIWLYEDKLQRIRNRIEEFKTEETLYQLQYVEENYSDPFKRIETRELRKLMQEEHDCEVTLETLQRRYQKLFTKRIRTESATYQAEVGPVDDSAVDMHGNLCDEGGEEKDGITTGSTSYLRVSQDGLLSIDEFFSRPVEIANFTISVGSLISNAYEVWNLYTLDPTVRAKLRNYSSIAGDLHIRVAISGTPFHFGKILCSPQYYPLRNSNITNHMTQLAVNPTGARDLFLNYLSQATGAKVIDVQSNRPVEITMPFLSMKNMHRLYNSNAAVIGSATSFDDLSEAGSLYFYSINDLRTASTVDSDISVQIYAWMENVQLGCTTATQMTISTESKEILAGPVERVSTALAYVSGALTKIPSIAPLARASQSVFKGIAGVASWFGWSKPPIVSQPAFVKNQPFMNGCQTVGSETLKRLTFDPLQELTVDPRIFGVEEDELTISHLASIETYLTKFQWTEEDVRLGSPLFISKVHPQLDTFLLAGGIYRYQPTAMSFVSAPFQYWHGTIKFRFEIVASNFHRGKIAFIFEPNIAQSALINSAYELNKNYMHIVDIQQTKDIELCIEWAHPRAWAKLMPPGTTHASYGSGFSPSAYSYEYANGYLAVVPFTELSSPNNSNVTVNVYVSCDNIMLQQPSSVNIPTSRIVQTESRELSDVEVTCYPLVETNTSVDAMALHHFGEQPLSLRSLLKRYVTTAVRTVGAGLVGNNTLVFTGACILPSSPLYGQTLSRSPSLIQYLPYAFLGVRGGMRHRFHLRSAETATNSQPVSMGPLSKVAVTLNPPETDIGGGLAWATKDVVNDLNGSVSFLPRTNGGIEFEVPFYSNNLFAFSFSNDLVGAGNAVNEMVSTWSKRYIVDVEMDTNTSDTNTAILESAIGEDFSFFKYNGAPFFSAVSII